MDEFSARSIVTGGREAPMDLAREIAEKVAPMRQQRMILKSLEIRKMLMFGAPNAEAAKARLEQERPRLPRTVYEQQRRLILDLLRMENEENIIRGGGPGTRTFGAGGTQTEGRKRLRKPTETPTGDGGLTTRGTRRNRRLSSRSPRPCGSRACATISPSRASGSSARPNATTRGGRGSAGRPARGGPGAG